MEACGLRERGRKLAQLRQTRRGLFSAASGSGGQHRRHPLTVLGKRGLPDRVDPDGIAGATRAAPDAPPPPRRRRGPGSEQLGHADHRMLAGRNRSDSRVPGGAPTGPVDSEGGLAHPPSIEGRAESRTYPRLLLLRDVFEQTQTRRRVMRLSGLVRALAIAAPTERPSAIRAAASKAAIKRGERSAPTASPLPQPLTDGALEQASSDSKSASSAWLKATPPSRIMRLEGRGDLRVELGAGDAADLLQGGLGADRAAVGVARGHHVVGVGHGDDRAPSGISSPAMPAG